MSENTKEKNSKNNNNNNNNNINSNTVIGKKQKILINNFINK